MRGGTAIVLCDHQSAVHDRDSALGHQPADGNGPTTRWSEPSAGDAPTERGQFHMRLGSLKDCDLSILLVHTT